MTDLDKTVKRRSHATRTEASKSRRVIVTLEPDQKIGFRLEGTRDTYRLDIESGYELAVRSHVSDVEKRAQQLKKSGLRAASARAQARKELKGRLR
jgi:phosphoglucomutase